MAGVQLQREVFGKTKAGETVEKFTFRSEKLTVSVINYGGVVSNILVPDRDGNVKDVALGYDDVAGYEVNFPYIGAICGRNAGRISYGQFILDGQTYKLPVNNGINSIHGGLKGFTRVVWDADIVDDAVKMTYVSKDGDEGYPGDVTTTVIYRMSEDRELTLEYTATTTKACPLNLTNHSYFNLAGQEVPSIFDHVVQIHGDAFIPVDDSKDLIPTGKIESVDGKPQDVRTPTLLSDREEAVREGMLDVTYAVGETGKLKAVAKMSHPPSGRYVVASTTEPGLQFYTSSFMKDIQGKGGVVYDSFCAFCLETQHYPDSINHDNFPNTVLRPGETYRQITTYKFAAE